MLLNSKKAIRLTKSDLRREFRAARRAFVAGVDSTRRTGLEQALADQVAPMLQAVVIIGSYAAVADEIDPAWIEKRVGSHAFPRVSGSDISYHAARRHDLRPGFQGIPEPPATTPLVEPDLLLVPLIAVTLSGVRLGQGRGYYDRALADLHAAAVQRGRPLLAIGVAWECQIAACLPADPWDMPLDMIATPERLVDCRKPR